MGGTTDNRSYPYPLSTDNVDPPGDIKALADAVDVDMASVLTVVSDTSIGTAQSGFPVTTQIARTVCGGQMVDVVIVVTNTAAITATSGDITNTIVFVLDADYRPQSSRPAIFTTGSQTGAAFIAANGNVQIQTASATIPADSTITIADCYVKLQ